jgi:single-strand DNA-binding protein
VNQGTFAGYIGRDAETKPVKDTTVTNFSIGVSTGLGDKKSTLWVSCALWGDRGQKLAQYLTKGGAVTVSGDVDVRAYAAKDGTPKAEITCNVQRLTLQGGRGERQETSPAQTGSKPAAAAQDDEFGDSIPF